MREQTSEIERIGYKMMSNVHKASSCTFLKTPKMCLQGTKALRYLSPIEVERVGWERANMDPILSRRQGIKNLHAYSPTIPFIDNNIVEDIEIQLQSVGNLLAMSFG